MFKQQLTQWLDPILLIGIFISIGIGGIMVLAGNDTLTSLIISLLSTIITLLIDAIAKIQKTEKSFLNAAELSSILSDKFIGSTLQELAKNFESIKKYNFDHFNNLAIEAIDECRSKLRDMSGGSIIVTAKTIQGYGVKGTESARKDIKTIHIGDMNFWNSDFGKKYFELNRVAIKRGVQITRIFALSPEEVKTYLEILKEQERAGIRVLITKPGRVDHEFAIFDDWILVDFKVNHVDDYRLERIILESSQVKRFREEFKEIITRYGKTIKDALSDE